MSWCQLVHLQQGPLVVVVISLRQHFHNTHHMAREVLS